MKHRFGVQLTVREIENWVCKDFQVRNSDSRPEMWHDVTLPKQTLFRKEGAKIGSYTTRWERTENKWVFSEPVSIWVRIANSGRNTDKTKYSEKGKAGS